MIDTFLSLGGLARRLDVNERKARSKVRTGALIPDGLLGGKIYIFKVDDSRLEQMRSVIQKVESNTQIIA